MLTRSTAILLCDYTDTVDFETITIFQFRYVSADQLWVFFF